MEQPEQNPANPDNAGRRIDEVGQDGNQPAADGLAMLPQGGKGGHAVVRQ